MKTRTIKIKRDIYKQLVVTTADGSEVIMTEIECAAYIGAMFGATLQDLTKRPNEWTMTVSLE